MEEKANSRENEHQLLRAETTNTINYLDNTISLPPTRRENDQHDYMTAFSNMSNWRVDKVAAPGFKVYS